MGGHEAAAGLLSGEAAAEILERKADLGLADEAGDVGVAGSKGSGSSRGGSEFLGGKTLTSEEAAGLTDVDRTNLAAGTDIFQQRNQAAVNGGNSDEGEWCYSVDDVPDEAVSAIAAPHQVQSVDQASPQSPVESYASLDDAPEEPVPNIELLSSPVETPPPVVDRTVTPPPVVGQAATPPPIAIPPPAVDQAVTPPPIETPPLPVDERAAVAEQVAKERQAADEGAFEAAASETTRQRRDIRYADQIRDSYDSKYELPRYRTGYAKLNDGGGGGIVMIENPMAGNGGTILNSKDPIQRLEKLARKP